MFTRIRNVYHIYIHSQGHKVKKSGITETFVNYDDLIKVSGGIEQ